MDGRRDACFLFVVEEGMLSVVDGGCTLVDA